MDTIELKSSLKDLEIRLIEIRDGVFNLIAKEDRLKEIENDLTKEEVWSDLDLSQKINKEKTSIEKNINLFKSVFEKVSDNIVLLEIAIDESDQQSVIEISKEYPNLQKQVDDLELSKMFTKKMDSSSAYIEIQSGSGGTEAQDWAEMLLRMYSKWAESRDFSIEVTDISYGEVAGIKSATIHVTGDHSYGWLRTETGVHRLVRKSPFDSGNRRHTSFASVFISPEVDDSIEITINNSDIRVDTYRASGAGGQHVNKTDSAIRITHLPTKINVQCQSNRSQHRNKAIAMEMLKSKLYDIELKKEEEKNSKDRGEKSQIAWGHQIRSYIMQPYQLVKDHRTGYEDSNVNSILDGKIDRFLENQLVKL